MCFVKYLTVAFSVGLPVQIKNPVPANQARFPDFRVMEVVNIFALKAATCAVIVGHFLRIYELFIDRSFSASMSPFAAKCKVINVFQFLPRNNGRGGLRSGLAQSLA